MKGNKNQLRQKEVHKKTKKSPKALSTMTPVKIYQPNSGMKTASSDPSMLDIIQQTKNKAVALSASKQNRDQLQDKLDNLTAKEGFRQELFIGFNSVNKALEKNELAVLCISKKSNNLGLQFLLEACKLRKVPLAIVPTFSTLLKDSLKVKNAFCFGIRKRTGISGVDQDMEKDLREVAADELKDYIVALSTEQSTWS